MIGVMLIIFSVMDGAVRLNTAASAAPVRGVMITLLALSWLAWMHRSGVRLPLPGAIALGVLAAYMISEAYWRPGGYGIQGWLIVSGMYMAQGLARREWARDLAVAGIILAILVLLAASTGQAPPDGMWNRNMVAGLLAALLPATWATWRPGAVIVAAAIAIAGSRGAWVAAGVAIAVMAWPTLVARRLLAPIGLATIGIGAAPVAAVAFVGLYGLITMRSITLFRRFECAAQVLALWWARSPLFGLGEFQMRLATGELANNAHSVPLTLAAVLGLAGLAVIAASVAGLATWRIRPGWQLAALLAICAHALIEENIAWWPVGIVLGIVAADCTCQDRCQDNFRALEAS